MKYPSISIQGNILSSDLLDQLAKGEFSQGQHPKDFGVQGPVKEEILFAWAEAQDHWRIFQRRIERLDEGQTGTAETRKHWMLPLLKLLGYEVGKSNAETVDKKSYAISHRETVRDGFPIHLMGVRDSLDKRRKDSGPRMSPHALVQEYLNLTEHLYALVSNGYQLRLLRDASRLVQLSYLEFNLEQMMEEEHFADFALLYRLLHVSRMPQRHDAGNESLIEAYHQRAMDDGSRIREGLSKSVQQVLLDLGNGFLEHPENEALRSQITEGTLQASDYYHELLTLIYRMLFLFVIEGRKLVYPSKADRKQREVYENYYSLERLRSLSEKRYLADPRHQDLWIALRQSFRLFEAEKYGKALGIAPLAGALFGKGALSYLDQAQLSNQVLLSCIKRLNTFRHEDSGQLRRVNYASLNVEEFGSVYENLLDLEAVLEPTPSGTIRFLFRKGSERSSSGSHYTPDELVKPLIEHSLDHLIEEKLQETDPERALLSLKVCDVACGSGHILLAAARRIGTELARVRTGEDQPSPQAFRQAVRDAIRHCIYGVDKNPLAVELCKVALWLEAHNPGEPLNFLDHHIKCGDAIVGLAHHEEIQRGIADEAFKKLPGDDKEVAKKVKKRNKDERKHAESQTTLFEEPNQDFQELAQRFAWFQQLPEGSSEEIAKKAQEYLKLSRGKDWMRLKLLADIQVGQFFLTKTEVNQEYLVTEGAYRYYRKGQKLVPGQIEGKYIALAQEKRFFHWFLEFPEVFGQGGFDCVLGNPPFLGGQKLSGTYGDSYPLWLKYQYAPAGSCDLVAYFFRRIFNILRPKGFQSLISTNTIAQGNSREGGLAVIKEKGGTINHAIRSMKWPGLAAVEVAMVSIYKGEWKKAFVLDRKKVPQITSYLDDTEPLGDPHKLVANTDKSFQGSIVLGKGFILDETQVRQLLAQNPRNTDVLFPYLNGADLNGNIDQQPARWVINFFDWEEDYCRENYPECFEIVERLVKPEREENTYSNSAKKMWWQYERYRPELYRTIEPLERVLVAPRVTKYLSINSFNIEKVFSDQLTVFALRNYQDFSLLQGSYHDLWAWKNSSTMGGSTLRYSPSGAFETLPFPLTYDSAFLEEIGEIYFKHRQNLMFTSQLGLTDTYNLFHNSSLLSPEGTPWGSLEQAQALADTFHTLSDQAIAAQYNKELRKFVQHIASIQGTSFTPSVPNRLKDPSLPIHEPVPAASLAEAIHGIWELRRLHVEMDQAVLAAYGWGPEGSTLLPPEAASDPTYDSPIDLAHGFYEVDYLPENDRVRFTISPEARKEVLKRLLLLNHARYEEEVKAGLHEQGRKGNKNLKKDDISSINTIQGTLFK